MFSYADEQHDLENQLQNGDGAIAEDFSFYSRQKDNVNGRIAADMSQKDNILANLTLTTTLTTIFQKSVS